MAKPRVPVINWSDPLSKGLILAMPMTESGGGTVYDYSLNKNHGTINGSVGRLLNEDGGGLDFTRSTSVYVNVPYIPAYDVKNITVVYVGHYDSTGHTLSTAVSRWENGVVEVFLMGIGSTADTYRFSVYTGATLRNAQSATTAFQTGTKRIIVGTFDRFAVKLYVDGIEEASSSQTAADLNTGNKDIRIGGRVSATSSHFWDGGVDLVLIYDHAFTPQSVAEISQDPYRLFKPTRYFRIQNSGQVGTGGTALITVSAFNATALTPSVGQAGTALVNVTAFNATGLISEADILVATSETYQIIKAEINSDSAAVVFDVGQANLFKYKLPHNIWHDFRCEWVYKSIGECDYGRDEFQGLTEMDVKKSGDGTQDNQGWYALNFGPSGVATADVNITAPDFYSTCLKQIYDCAWKPGKLDAPYLYKKFAACDFEFEFDTSGTGNETEESEGILITTESNTPSVWCHFRKQHRFGTNHTMASFCTDGAVENLVFDLLSGSEKLFKISKVGQTFTFYARANDTVGWTLKGTAEIPALNGVALRVGLLAATNSSSRTTDFLAKFDYFRLLSGGIATCAGTLSDCRLRDNTRRFGGAPGILHGPLIL